MPRPSSGRSRGFTLVELLIVIGIIAVLIGISFPAFSAIRSRAMVTMCQSNLKQIANGLQLYANDNRDAWPDGETLGLHGLRQSPGKKTFPNDWTSLPEVYGLPSLLHGIGKNDKLDVTGLPKPRYLDGTSRIWICPAYREDRRAFGNTYFVTVAEFFVTSKNPQTNDIIKTKASLKSFFRSKASVDGTGYVWDNINLNPGLTGFPGKFTGAGYTLKPNERTYAHRLGTRRATASNFLFLDGHLETRINDE